MTTRIIPQTIPAGFTGVYTLQLGAPIPSTIYVTAVDVLGMSGTMIPQYIIDNAGVPTTVPTPNYQNTAYFKLAPATSYAAGTTITLDGTYEIQADAGYAVMNVTVAPTTDVTLRVRILEGSTAPSSSSGGGGAVTGTDADNATNSTVKLPVIAGVANAAAPSWTEGHEVPESMDLSGRQRVLSTSAAAAADNSTNSTSKTPVLAGTANAAAPAWTEGRQVPASVDLSGNLRALLAASAAYIGHVGGTQPVVASELTRPNDTNAYIAGDAIANATSGAALNQLTGASRVASLSGRALKFRLMTDQVGCVAQIRIWFYNASAPSVINADNAPFLAKYADKAIYIGYVDMPALATTIGTSDCAFAQLTAQLFPFVADASSIIYYAYQTATAFTPAAQQKFYLAVNADQD